MSSVNNIKLDDITLEYNSFVDSQVLTAKQLNDIVEFFEDQQRLTRTCLIGVGLVCGLSFKGDQNGITVSKGCGVTTDGDLLYAQQTVYNNFRPYDNSLIKYSPFYPLGTDQAQMDLWELVIPDSDNKLPVDSLPLSGFKAKTGSDVKDMVGMLYLEYYSKEPDACTAIDCDNQGRKQVAKPKVLLLSPTNMDQVINRNGAEAIADDLFKSYYNAYTQYFNLPVLAAGRVFLKDTVIASASTLSQSYVNVVKAGAPALVGAVKNLYDTFKFVVDPTSANNIAVITAQLSNALNQTITPLKAQYFYDFYKDIISNYNELRTLLTEIVYQCCPDVYSFPKHIMLGALNPVTQAQPSTYRHRFYQSPAITQNKARLDDAINLLQRMFLLIGNFAVPNTSAVTKITPSVNYDKPLADRAIPYYYTNAAQIAAKWSYGRWRMGTDKQVLGYNASQYAAGNDAVINPLNYSIDANDFFRIEGHLGKTYTQALQDVDKIRQDFNLPFDLVAIRLGSADLSDIDVSDFACQFNDLEAILKAFKAEQNCLYAAASKFFSNFNAKTGYAYEVAPEIKFNLVNDATLLAEQQANLDLLSKRQTGLKAAKPTAARAAAPNAAESVNMQASFGVAESRYVKMPSGTDVIDTNIVSVQGSTGSLINLIRQDGAMTIADYGDKVAAALANTDLGDDEKALAVDIPVRIIAGTRIISQWLPDRLVDIDDDAISNFSTHLDELCKEIKSAFTRSRTIFGRQDYVKKGFEDDYQLNLWQLSENCCAGEALQVILNEIQIRKENLLKQLTFSSYAASHRGLEHKAGVPAGGTFVMVYSSAATTTPVVTGDNTDTRFKELDNSPDFLRGFANDEDAAKYIAANVSPEDAKDALAYYQRSSGRQYNPKKTDALTLEIARLAAERVKKQAQQTNDVVPANVVFADFCLPYLCCSDCPPVAFIMPQPKVTLTLPKAVACSDDGLLAFKANPTTGVVKAAAGFENTVVVKDDGITYFDPAQVTAELFGKAITFTLDDQLTDCTISVIKHPDIKPTAVKADNNDQMVFITLDAETNQANGDTFTYTWNLPDGRVIGPQSSPLYAATFNYDDLRQLPNDGKVPPSVTLNFTLTATNQSCSNAQPASILITLPQQQVALELAASAVCSDNGNVAFTTVKPDGGVVASVIAGAAVQQLGGQWVIDPTNGPYDTLINDFTVDGEPAPNCVLTIHEHPRPSFTAKQQVDTKNKSIIVVFENTTPNPDSFNFVWDLGDDDNSKEVSPKKVFDMTKYPRGRSVLIALTASNKADAKCQASFKPRTPIVLPPVSGEVIKVPVTPTKEVVTPTKDVVVPGPTKEVVTPPVVVPTKEVVTPPVVVPTKEVVTTPKVVVPPTKEVVVPIKKVAKPKATKPAAAKKPKGKK